MSDLVIGMAGAGGDGIIAAGESLTVGATLDGYHVIMTKSFGSQIRGGESSCRVRVSATPIFNQGGVLDVAVALNWSDFLKFGAELPVGPRTIVLYDSESHLDPAVLPVEGYSEDRAFSVPITEMARKSGGGDRVKNMVVVGLLTGWLQLAEGPTRKGIRKRFGAKDPAVLAAAEKAFDDGRAYAAANPIAALPGLGASGGAAGTNMLTDGNEMCASAALFSGCTFFGGYPITPSTEIMQFLSREIWKYGGSLLQAEDEIAGIGAAVGASFAGKKSMTATSGPGLSLKTEVLGLASIAELPLVVVNVQRGGPSTGMPTKTEQADLYQSVFSSHGDVLRPVLAPTSVADIFGVTVHAFNIAEEYQTPVILLSDQEIAQRKESVEPFDLSQFPIVSRREPTAEELEHYQRFRLTESSISPISHPGMAGGSYQGAGIEHNEAGSPTASGVMHARMNEKRFHKFAPLYERRDLFLIEGDPQAPLALVSWGSTAGVCREALRLAEDEGLPVKLLVPYLLYPVAEKVYQEFFRGVSAGLLVEQSYQGQLYRILRMVLDLPSGFESCAHSGAIPFQPSEVVDHLRGQAEKLGLLEPAAAAAS